MADVSFTIEAIDKASGVMKGLSGSIITLNQGLQLAGQAMQAINKIVDATIGEYIKYADQVRTISQLTNQSAETSSKLIQVTEDYKISVEDLTTASRKLATQGLSLTVDTIAELSDKYNALNTGAERQTFLTQNLGRASAEWTNILSQGSAAIKARGALVEKSLILTQGQIDKTRTYEMQLDDLDDKWKAMKVSVGSLTLPIIIKVLTAGFQASQIGDSFKQLNDQAMIGAKSFKEYNDSMYKFIDTLTPVEQQLLPQTINGIDLMTEAEYNSAKALYTWNQNSYEATIAAGKMGKALGDLKPPTDDYSKSVSQIASSWQDVGYNAIVAAAELDGVVTEDEITKILDYQVAMGLLSQSESDAKLQAYYLRDAITGIPTKWASDVTITTWFVNQNKTIAPGGPGQTLYDSGGGGSGASGGAYWIPDPNNPGHYMVNPAKKAGGGAFSGWAMVGDAAGGNKTPYTEYVYAPHGATVFNQAQMSGQSAPPMSGGGFIPPMANEVTLSDKSIRDIALALAYEMAK